VQLPFQPRWAAKPGDGATKKQLFAMQRERWHRSRERSDSGGNAALKHTRPGEKRCGAFAPKILIGETLLKLALHSSSGSETPLFSPADRTQEC